MWYAPSAVIIGQQYHKPCSERKRKAKTISSCCVCLCSQLQSLTCKIYHQWPTERPESHSRYKNQYKAASQWGQIIDSHQDVKCVVSRPPHTPLPISDHFPAVPSKCFSFAVCSSCPCFSSQVFPIFFTTHSAYTVPSLNTWISGFWLSLICISSHSSNFVNEHPVATSWQQKLGSFMIRTTLKPGTCESEDNYTQSVPYIQADKTWKASKALTVP